MNPTLFYILIMSLLFICIYFDYVLIKLKQQDQIDQIEKDAEAKVNKMELSELIINHINELAANDFEKAKNEDEENGLFSFLSATFEEEDCGMELESWIGLGISLGDFNEELKNAYDCFVDNDGELSEEFAEAWCNQYKDAVKNIIVGMINQKNNLKNPKL